MNSTINSTPTIWLNFSPAFGRFNRSLVKHLAKNQTILQWDYCQTADEASSIDIGLELLERYLASFQEKVHLIGHSTSGLLALLYAKKNPEKVKSLSLLSVGIYPALDWQAYYYSQVNLLNYSRYFVLSQIASNLIECRCLRHIQKMVEILEEDLISSISPHSLYRQLLILPEHIPVPLFVGAGDQDLVVNPGLFAGWNDLKKEQDRLWLCPGGKYFFHYEQPELTAQKLNYFWRSLALNPGQKPLQPVQLSQN